MRKMFRLSNFTIMYVLLLSNRFVESQFASNYTVVPPFRVQKIAEDVPLARTILQDEAGDLLVVASGSSQIYSLYETTHGDGTVTINKVIILDRPDLEFNHGMTYKNGFLYVSNPRAVYRWPYKAGLRAPITAREEVVISNIPFRQSEKGYKDPHITRTIIFDKEGRLLVQVGAGDNIDVDSSRCRIRRFELPDPLPFGGLNFDSGIVMRITNFLKLTFCVQTQESFFVLRYLLMG
jgi:glucose/arabinose dehydrogenase